jgi:lipopolysaccharide/colanic/teichoic acid biosynthesis glycosyltransferase
MMRGISTLRKSLKTSPDQQPEISPAHRDGSGGKNCAVTLAPEEMFRRVLSLERKRSERSRQHFVLMLLHTGKLLQTEKGDAILAAIIKGLSQSIRETDIPGWYQTDRVLGVICTGIGSGSMASTLSALHSRVFSALRNEPDLKQMNEIHISFHVYPEDLDLENGGHSGDISLYTDLEPMDKSTKLSLGMKRAIDILGSTFALLLLSPIFLFIAVVIKLTSEGTIFFKQQRLGRYGVCFTFYKFRSMYFQNDAKIHREYVQKLISAQEDCGHKDGSEEVYKIKDDPRVTPFGRFLRRTSLDELPQFFNVLKGDMSLVGPRPPIPYEVSGYDIWHRRRFLEIKPGITGLWQVEGRSRVKFDEMVRMDIKYAKTWSLWLDFKILFRTPKAVFRGIGAF